MPFTFKIQFAALCHFIENGDDSRDCQICVILPKVPKGRFSPRAHEPRLVYQSNFLSPRPPVPAQELTVECLEGKRVAFRFVTPDDAPLPAPQLRGRLEKTVAVEQLVSDPGPYVDFGKDAKNTAIASKIFLQHGTLEEATPAGNWRLDGPNGDRFEGPVPPFVTVTVDRVEVAEVVVTPIGGGRPNVLRFENPSADPVGIVISADCDFRTAGSPPATALRGDTPDADFGAHYTLFPHLAEEAERQPVPLQLAPPTEDAEAFDAAAAESRRLQSDRRLEIKPPAEDGPPVGGGGSGTSFVDESAIIMSTDPPAGTGGGGGGSACLRGRSFSRPEFDVDTLLARF